MSSRSLTIRPEFMPLSLLRAVWKHRFLGAFVAIAVAAAGIGVTYRLPAVYKAEALILVDPQKIPERFVVSTVNTEAWDRLNAIRQEINSGTRLKKIIEEFDLYRKERQTMTDQEIIDRMRNDIQIEFEKGVGGSRPGAFRIAYIGGNPAVLAQVVNRITNLYLEENLRSRENQAEGTFDFIEHQLRDAKQALDRQEEALASYKLRHNGELPQQENALNGKLTRLQLELQGNQDAINRAQQAKVVQEGALNAAESAVASLSRSQAGAPRIAADPDIEVPAAAPVPLRPQKPSEVLEAQIAKLRLRYSEAYPEIRRLRAELAAQLQVEQEEDTRQVAAVPAVPNEAPKKPRVAPRPDPARDALALERSRAEARVAELKVQHTNTVREIQAREAERERILRDIADSQRRIEQLPVRDLEMASLTRNYEFSRNYYNALLSKKTEAEMATDLEKRQKAETFRILDAARPPQKPFKPKRELFSAASILLGLLSGLAVALLRELRAGVLLGEWELPAGVTVLSRVPHIEPVLKALDEPEERRGKKHRASLTAPLALRSPAVLLLIAALWKVTHV